MCNQGWCCTNCAHRMTDDIFNFNVCAFVVRFVRLFDKNIDQGIQIRQVILNQRCNVLKGESPNIERLAPWELHCPTHWCVV